MHLFGDGDFALPETHQWPPAEPHRLHVEVPRVEYEKLLKTATQHFHLSARAYHRVLKLARTIANLAGSKTTQATLLAEAIQYRPSVSM